MRVAIFPADTAGCGHYRLIFAADHLRAMGHDIHIQWPKGRDSGFDVAFNDNNTMVDVNLPIPDVDVVVMQRISHNWHPAAMHIMREKGIATVVDMDDNLGAIHPKNTAYWNYSKRSPTPFSFKNAEIVCREATLVTVSTRNLLRAYASHGRGVVIDNYIPERYLYINELRDEEPTFGWGGTMKSHPTDLLVLGSAVRDLIKEGHRFKVVGPHEPPVAQQLRIDAATMEASGVIDMFMWPSALAQNLDVGMAPLEPGTFNSSKSRLKLLEYAAVSIPYVASPREEYRRFHKESGGVGVLADTPKQWVAGIRDLMTAETRRKELGQQARAYAATQTVEQHAWRWLEAWQRALDIQQGKIKS